MRFKITQVGEDALRGIGKLGDAECARREVANVLLEVVQLSHDKTMSLESEWQRWCEEQYNRFEAMDAKYFRRR